MTKDLKRFFPRMLGVRLVLSEIKRFFAKFTLNEVNVLRMTTSEGMTEELETLWNILFC